MVALYIKSHNLHDEKSFVDRVGE